MKIPIYQIDAFTDRLFHGNPAAICPLDEWPPDDLLQNIAAENNLSETGFYVQREGHYEIRWMTPTLEVDLCGHATLAAAHVIFHHGAYDGDVIDFHSRSGLLKVSRQGDLLALDFPVDVFVMASVPEELISGLQATPIEGYKGKADYLLVFSSQKEIENLRPDFARIARVPARGVIVTSRGERADFVSRFFAPQSGVPEDPVTGSAHTTLTPYWAAKLNKTELTAQQLSKRGGFLKCRLSGDRVEIAGRARTYMVGEIEVYSR